jgi:hypothetical protein
MVASSVTSTKADLPFRTPCRASNEVRLARVGSEDWSADGFVRVAGGKG